MNEITYNNYDLVAFEQNGEVVVAVTFYIDGEPDARNWWIRSQNTVPRYLPVNLSS